MGQGLEAGKTESYCARRAQGELGLRKAVGLWSWEAMPAASVDVTLKVLAGGGGGQGRGEN